MANQIRTVNRDKLNDIKNLLLFLATKYTEKDEEFDEIERLVKMEGGIIQNTINHFIRIGRQEGIEEGKEEGIQTMAKELKKIGVKEEVIEEVTNNAKKK